MSSFIYMDTQTGTRSEEGKMSEVSLVSGNLDLDPQKQLYGYEIEQKYVTASQFVDTCVRFVFITVCSGLQIISHINF